MKVLDVAFSRITSAWAQARLTEGWEVLIQDCWTGGYANNDALRAVAESNLRVWREAGGKTAIYTNAAPWRSPQVWFDETVKNAGSELQHITRVLVDIEIAEGNTVIKPADVRTYIKMWQDAGFTVATYSGDWYVGFWKIAPGQTWVLGSPIDFGVPYWYASYDNVPILGQPTHPLGPVVGKQYGGSPPDLDGVTVDFNVFEDSFFKDSKDSKEVDMFRAKLPSGAQYMITPRGTKIPVAFAQAPVYDRAGVVTVDVSEEEILQFPDDAAPGSFTGASGTFTVTNA